MTPDQMSAEERERYVREQNASFLARIRDPRFVALFNGPLLQSRTQPPGGTATGLAGALTPDAMSTI